MQVLSNLIDAGTLTKKILVQSLHRKKESGWMVCIIAGAVHEKFMYFTSTGDRFILHDSTEYRIDTPLKPCTANYKRHELVGYY